MILPFELFCGCLGQAKECKLEIQSIYWTLGKPKGHLCPMIISVERILCSPLIFSFIDRIALGPCGLFALKQGVVARQTLSLAKEGARGSPSQVKLGVSGLHCLTALPSHWPSHQPASPVGRASAPAQDFPAKEGRHRWCQPCSRLSLPAAFLRRKKTLVPHFSWS